MPRCASRGGGHLVSPTMTKKNPPGQRETLNPTTITRNAMGIQEARDSGFITRWLKNRKRGLPLKNYPANRREQEKEG